MKWDETFLELTLEDIKENIEAAAKCRAKRPKEWVTQLWAPGRRVTIVVRTEPS